MLALTGCTAFNNSDDGTADGNGTSATTQTFQPSGGKPTATLSIASGSENKEVAVAIQKAADQSNVAVTMHYMGSLEIMNALKAGGQDHDAVWPASSMWISMGDTKHIVKDAASTSTTPIVFGIAKSKAVKLGWADDTGATKPVSTADILAAVSDGKLTFSMTSATVIDSALNVYQTALRKPSWTIWVVDYSGSMSGEGKNGVVKGLNAALDPDQAKKSYIEPASGDVNILIPFETEVHRPVKATGTSTSDLLHEADATDASGGTDIYEGLLSALDELPSESEASQYTTAIVLIICAVVSANSAKIMTSGLLILAVVILHNLLGYLTGFGVGKLLKLDSTKCRAISIEVGMQNSGLATSLAATHFAQYPLATIPGAVFSVWHNISGAVLANFYARSAEKSESSAAR